MVFSEAHSKHENLTLNCYVLIKISMTTKLVFTRKKLHFLFFLCNII
jgi:hypothetical protein